MRSFFIVFIFFLSLSPSINAQQTATTIEGKIVILYDNGTWKYSEQKNNLEVNSLEVLKIDDDIELKDGSSNREVVVLGVSAKLKKYFKTQNLVQSNFTIVVDNNEATLISEWKVQTGEAFSYFGFINKGAKLSFALMGDKKVDLVFNKEIEPKEFEKYKFSIYKAELKLSKEDLIILQSSYIKSVSMEWSRRTEEYEIKNPTFFINEIPKLKK